jgi:anaerobic nitric oxide reductase transcription regulator
VEERVAEPAAAPPPEAGAVAVTPAIAAASGLREATESFQRQWIEQALWRHQGSMAAVAREAGMDRSNLLRLARRLHVRAGARNAA